MDYAGFWVRLSATLIDFLFFVPLLVLCYFLGETFRLFYLYWFIPELIIGMWFHAYLVLRYGGTPGKLLLKIRISMVDGSPVTFKAAFLRYSVLFFLTALSSIAIATSTLTITNDQYFSLSYLDRSKKLVELAPPWYEFVKMLTQVWISSEFLTMMFNKKRRAIHDFIAGTIVVRLVSLPNPPLNTDAPQIGAPVS